jgi:hypothetical protein
MGSCSCVRFAPRALFGAVDIVREITFLPRALSYSGGCSICWSINLRLSRVKLVVFLNIRHKKPGFKLIKPKRLKIQEC